MERGGGAWQRDLRRAKCVDPGENFPVYSSTIFGG